MRNKILKTFYVVCLVIIAISVPVVVQAAALRADPPPVVDWNQLVFKILAFSIPLLVGAIIAQVVASVRYGWAKLQLERPDLADLIVQAGYYAAPVVEQLKKNGTILNNEVAKRRGMEIAQFWLAAKGVSPEMVKAYIELLDHSLEAAVGSLHRDTTTVTLTPIERS